MAGGRKVKNNKHGYGKPGTRDLCLNTCGSLSTIAGFVGPSLRNYSRGSKCKQQSSKSNNLGTHKFASTYYGLFSLTHLHDNSTWLLCNSQSSGTDSQWLTHGLLQDGEAWVKGRAPFTKQIPCYLSKGLLYRLWWSLWSQGVLPIYNPGSKKLSLLPAAPGCLRQTTLHWARLLGTALCVPGVGLLLGCPYCPGPENFACFQMCLQQPVYIHHHEHFSTCQCF